MLERERDRTPRVAPYLLTATGGAAVSLLWLKVGALLGTRAVCEPRYLTGYVVATGVLGALLALIAMTIWSSVTPRVVRGEQGTSGRVLRFVWGAAAFPHLIALVVLLPLDLLIVGRATFTTDRIDVPLHTMWMALSIAIGISVTVWNLWLLVRGFQAAVHASIGRALAATALAVAAITITVAAFVVAAQAGVEGERCLTTSP